MQNMSPTCFLGDLCSTSWSFEPNLMCLKASFQFVLFKNDALPAGLQGVVGHKKAEEAQQGREAQGVVGEKAGVELTSWRHRCLLQCRRRGSNHHRDSRSSNLFLVSNRSTGNAEHVSYLFLGDLCSTSWSFETNLMCLLMTMRRHIKSIKASFQVLLFKMMPSKFCF